jgi:hypothetical protein
MLKCDCFSNDCAQLKLWCKNLLLLVFSRVCPPVLSVCFCPLIPDHREASSAIFVASAFERAGGGQLAAHCTRVSQGLLMLLRHSGLHWHDLLKESQNFPGPFARGDAGRRGKRGVACARQTPAVRRYTVAATCHGQCVYICKVRDVCRERYTSSPAQTLVCSTTLVLVFGILFYFMILWSYSIFCT